MKLRKLLLSLAVIACMIPADAQTIYNRFGTDDISDLALIYIGGRHRPDWNKDLFRSYVVHSFADGHKSWLFDGFLMIEFMTQDESGKLSVSYGEYRAAGANQDEWEWLLDRQLGIETGLGCKALDEVIGEVKQELGGTLSHKHKVVLTIPVPVDNNSMWGRINGRPINFGLHKDKVEAIKWYADLAKKKWDAAGFKNIEFEGFYWVSEAMSTNSLLVKDASAYFHKIGLKHYWIPYFKAENRNNWEEYGFDIAYTQPNYFFQDTTPLEQLQNAIGESMTYGLGLEMEFEGYNFSYEGNNRPVVQYTPGNCALYGKSPVYYQRLVDYIDWFERFGVFASSAISYYSGYQGIYDFDKSGHPKDKELLDRLAGLIEERHIRSGWHPRELGGVDDTMLPDYTVATAGNGCITISESAGDNVTVTNIAGQTVFSATHNAGNRTISCQPGVYIVSTPDRTLKLVVR